MKLMVNGEAHEVDGPMSVRDLLDALGVNAQTVAVQRNEDILACADYRAVQLAEGDALELIRIVGGG